MFKQARENSEAMLLGKNFVLSAPKIIMIRTHYNQIKITNYV